METNYEKSIHWIYLTQNGFSKSGAVNVNFLFNEDNIYISDNHMCALWGWMQQCIPEEEYHFIHIDYHNDLRSPRTFDCIDIVSNAKSFPEFLQSRGTQEQFGQHLAWDTYIQIAYKMYPKWFSKTLFLTTKCVQYCEFYECRKPSTETLCKGCPKELFNRDSLDYYSCNLENLLKHIINGVYERKVILNIDIDYFFDCDDKHMRDDYWTNDKIDSLIPLLKEALDSNNIKVLTIAMSPECCNNNGKSSEDMHASYEVMSRFLPILSSQAKEDFSSVLLRKM